MPGHSEAFVRTFRHDMQSPEGMKILKLLVDEVCETFDVPYLHIGTDEVRFTNPKFVPEMVEYVRAKGKKVISWNPGWHYKPGEIDMTHLWSYRGKAQKVFPQLILSSIISIILILLAISLHCITAVFIMLSKEVTILQGQFLPSGMTVT